jgi:hypothetical protein
MPAGGGGAGFGGARLAQKQAHDAVVAGAQCEPPACGEVELGRLAPDLGKNGGKGSAAKGFFKNPQRLARAFGPYDDELPRIEAEAVEAGSIGMPRLAEGAGLDYQEDWAIVGFCEAGEDGNGEAGGGDGIAGGLAAHLMQRIATQAAGKQAVELRDAER